ncbi:hypothetical protein [Nitrospirillum amazonense]|uniref:hypothetical protein n=1 Tax=Nitrospirillum amazonense TaxID=28077 RepID=UPI002412AAD5|nr:hypothetical protein [Nitrospirillum amazonense]MDG3442873.1 hypothetical protein [Nitrospirillum amazonense]
MPKKRGRRLANLKVGGSALVRQIRQDGQARLLRVQRLKDEQDNTPGIPVLVEGISVMSPGNVVVWEAAPSTEPLRLRASEHIFSVKIGYAILSASLTKTLC